MLDQSKYTPTFFPPKDLPAINPSFLFTNNLLRCKISGICCEGSMSQLFKTSEKTVFKKSVIFLKSYKQFILKLV